MENLKQKLKELDALRDKINKDLEELSRLERDLNINRQALDEPKLELDAGVKLFAGNWYVFSDIFEEIYIKYSGKVNEEGIPLFSILISDEALIFDEKYERLNPFNWKSRTGKTFKESWKKLKPIYPRDLHRITKILKCYNRKLTKDGNVVMEDWITEGSIITDTITGSIYLISQRLSKEKVLSGRIYVDKFGNWPRDINFIISRDSTRYRVATADEVATLRKFIESRGHVLVRDITGVYSTDLRFIGNAQHKNLEID